MISEKIVVCVSKCQHIFGVTTLICENYNVNRHEWVKQQCISLNYVASKMEVFADHEQSIHHKLSDNPDCATSFLKVIEALKSDLKVLRREILREHGRTVPTSRLQEESVDNSAASASDSESGNDHEVVPVSLCQERIKNDLYQLNTTAMEVVRRCAEQASAKSREFRPHGNDGDILEPAFQRFIGNTLNAFETSHYHVAQACMEDWLKERLRKTMSARWRDISCRRDRCASTLKFTRYATGALSLSEAEKRPQAPPVVLDSNRIGDLRFPLAPEVEEDVNHFACPVCGLTQGTDILQQWEKHVLEDLTPYICVYKDCTEHWETYPTTAALIQHYEAAHAIDRWLCGSCRDSPVSGFETASDYEQHLRKKHLGPRVTEGQIAYVIEHARQRIPHKISDCRFCGFKPSSGQGQIGDQKLRELITDHMNDHMEAFALHSMPWDVLVGTHGARRATH